MVYTNLTSLVNIKSLINCPLGSYIDDGSITDNINIVTNMIVFKDSGLNKTIKTERIFGDSVVTSITRPTQIDVDLTVSLSADDISGSTTIQDVITQLGDFETIDDSYTVYSESDSKKRHRIALQWSDVSITYIKVYYNAYVQNINMINDTALELNIKLIVPIIDIHTGSANYYEYEGNSASSVLGDIDSAMLWS